jgi:hypothetical protein
MVPLIDGEIRICAHEDREKMPTKSLDGTLGLVGAFLRWGTFIVARRNVLVMLDIHCPRPGTVFGGRVV